MNDSAREQRHPLTDSQRTSILRRAAYARALGVDVWAARKALPGVDSHLVVGCVAPAAKANKATRSNDAHTSSQTPQRSRAHQALVSSLLDEDTVVAKQATRGSPKANKARTEDTRRGGDISGTTHLGAFDLFAKLTGNLLLVDDVTQMQAANSAYANWLSSVLQSLGLPVAVTLRASDRLRWPDAMGGAEVFRAQPLEQQRQQAQDLVSSWLLQKMQKAQKTAGPDQNGVSTLLLMGGVSSGLFDNDYMAGLAESNRYWQRLQLIRVPSSSELWVNPSAKRLFWQEIAKLNASR